GLGITSFWEIKTCEKRDDGNLQEAWTSSPLHTFRFSSERRPDSCFLSLTLQKAKALNPYCPRPVVFLSSRTQCFKENGDDKSSAKYLGAKSRVLSWVFTGFALRLFSNFSIKF